MQKTVRTTYDSTDCECVPRLVRQLALLMSERQFRNRPVIVLCIGSVRYTGDSLAPLVGTFLKEMAAPCPVYGELENPVHAKNLREVLMSINREHVRPTIIAIDAALGRPWEVGNIELWKGSLLPGISVDNHLPKCGDISIIGVVNTIDLPGQRNLEKTPLNIVYRHARIIAQAVNNVLSGEQIYDAEVSCS